MACRIHLVQMGHGRFGRFLACPGYPECSFTMPIVVEMPGKCPACGGRLLKRTSRKGFAYYACERGHDCPGHGEGEGGESIQGFMTWDVPTKDYCPECGKTMFKKAGKGFNWETPGYFRVVYLPRKHTLHEAMDALEDFLSYYHQ